MAQPNRGVVVVIGAMLIFLLINFNHDLSNSYLAIFVLTIILQLIDSKITIYLDTSSSNLLQDTAVGVFGYALFLGVSYIALAASQTVATTLGLMAEVTPVFQGSVVLSGVVFGLLAPIIENYFFFGVLLEFISDKANIPLNLKNIRSYGMYGIIAVLFALYHLTSKGLPTGPGQILNDPSLLITFIFGFISCLIVAYSKEKTGRNDLRPSIISHMVANTIAIAKRFAIV